MSRSSRRFYRDDLRGQGLESFTVKVKETDLWIAVDQGSYSEVMPQVAERVIRQQRHFLENYIKSDPGFATALLPHPISAHAPPLVVEMSGAADIAGVGPMASVAGAFAALAGNELLARCEEVIVENGGDLFLKINRERKVLIFAGESPFSERIALKLKPRPASFSICTSSGTVGPSLSFGCADAAVILSPRAALADAVATAACNRIKSKSDLERTLTFVRKIEGVEGALFICGDSFAAWGDLEIAPL